MNGPADQRETEATSPADGQRDTVFGRLRKAPFFGLD